MFAELGQVKYSIMVHNCAGKTSIAVQ